MLGVLTATLGVSGCMTDPDPQEAQQSVEESRSQVVDSLRDVASSTQDSGYPLPGATGEWLGCGVEPVRSMKYSAGGRVAADGEVAAAIADILAIVRDAGWSVEAEGTDPEPYATLTRDDLRLSLGESRRQPGTVSLGVTGPCVEATEEQDDLLGRPEQVIGE